MTSVGELEVFGAWFHTTSAQDPFRVWQVPPPSSSLDNQLGQHTAVFLARDRGWAERQNRGPICRAELISGAKVLDLRQPSPNSDKLRCLLLACEQRQLWRHTQQLRTVEAWDQDWRSGIAMDFQPASFQIMRWDQRKAEAARALNSISEGRNVSPSHYRAEVELRRQRRAWIEAICSTVQSMGYDAWIGREASQETRQSSAYGWDTLAVLKADVLTPPAWEDRQLQW